MLSDFSIRPWNCSATSRIARSARRATRAATAWPFLWQNPGPPGVYDVQIGDGSRFPVVVHADPRESDLTRSTEEERRAVAELLSIHYLEDGASPGDQAGDAETQEMWW